MAALAIRKAIIFILALASFFAAAEKPAQWGDSCSDHEFPMIGVAEKAPGEARFMSFNVSVGKLGGVKLADRADIVAKQILEAMPDSVGIQEATPAMMRVLTSKLSVYDWVGVERDLGGSPLSSGESCPVFYLKYKYSLVDSGHFWLSETPEKPSFAPGANCRRVCTWALLEDKASGFRFVHVNTHFDNGKTEARLLAADVVTAFIREHFPSETVIFTADMNTNVGSRTHKKMTSLLRDTRSSAQVAFTYGTFHDMSPETTREVVDYIMVSPSVTVTQYRVVTAGIDGRFVSDHFPIYADVHFP